MVRPLARRSRTEACLTGSSSDRSPTAPRAPSSPPTRRRSRTTGALARPTEEDVRRILGDPDIDLSLWIVAWAGDDVVGSVIGGIFPSDNAASGIGKAWLDRVSVRRPWRRQGVASALIVAALRELRARGMELAALGVDSDNPTGALGVYERLGFRRDRRSAAYRKPI